MLTPDTSTALVAQFQGSMQAQDPYDVDPAHGLYSQNLDFIIGSTPASGTAGIQCGTRRGTAQVAQITTGDGAILAIAPWFYSINGSQACAVAMYSAALGVRFYLQGSATFTGIVISVTGAAGAIFVTDGTRIYAAFYDSSGRKGVNQGYVYGLPSSGSYGTAADTVLAQPIASSVATVAATQPATGVITAGVHNYGFVFTTRNGYTGALNPVTSGGVFAPASFTAVDGIHNLQVVVTWASIPAYLNPSSAPTTPIIQLVMSTAANPNRYYLVPGATANVPSSPGTSTITASITDGDLTATGTDVTESQNLLTQSTSGTGPFNPSSIFAYSSRMAYVTIDASGFPVVYISDQNNYQSLTAAYHGIYLEGRQIPVHGCSLGGLCYIAALAGLYSTQDNGGYPGTWTPPQRVDGSVGILSPTCMIAVGGKILLASDKGLYIYRGGAFPTIPNSYFQAPDWNRINWLAPTQVQIVDDSLDRVIRVLAPLNVVIIGASNTNPITITTAIVINGAPVPYPHLFQTGLSVTISGVLGNTAANTTQVITVTGPNTFTIPVAGNGTYMPTPNQTYGGTASPNAANAQMCWNYATGEAPEALMYSLHAFASFPAASMAIVRNLANNKEEAWFGPAAAGGIIRRVQATDTYPFRDVNLSNNPIAINSLGETSLLPNSQDPSVTIHDYHGAHLRVTGNGSLNLGAFGVDHVRSVIPQASPLPISQTPGIEYLVKWFLRSEQQSIQFGTNAVDSYFIMALIRAYYSNSLPVR